MSARRKPSKSILPEIESFEPFKRSQILQSLNDYSYVPDEDIIAKLKYYYGPYNQVKGFRKYMDLPKGYGANDLKESKELWENISNYILYDKEGTLRKLPFRLDKYTEDPYQQNREISVCELSVISNKQKDSTQIKSRFAKRRKSSWQQDSRNLKKIDCSSTQTQRHIVISDFNRAKDYSNLLTPVAISTKDVRGSYLTPSTPNTFDNGVLDSASSSDGSSKAEPFWSQKLSSRND